MKPQYFPKPTLIPEQPLSVEDEDNEQSRVFKEHHFMKKRIQEIRIANQKKNDKERAEYAKKMKSQLQRARYLKQQYTYDSNGDILFLKKTIKPKDFPALSIECQFKLPSVENTTEISARDKDGTPNSQLNLSKVSFQESSKLRARSTSTSRPSSALRPAVRDAALLQTPEEQVYNSFTPSEGVSIKLQKSFYGSGMIQDEKQRLLVKENHKRVGRTFRDISPQLEEDSRITREQYGEICNARSDNLKETAKKQLMKTFTSLKLTDIPQRLETLGIEEDSEMASHRKKKDPRGNFQKARASSVAWKFTTNDQKSERVETPSAWTSRKPSREKKLMEEANFGATVSQDSSKKAHKIKFNTRPGLLEGLIGNSSYQLIWSSFRGDLSDNKGQTKEPSSPYFSTTARGFNQQELSPQQQQKPTQSPTIGKTPFQSNSELTLPNHSRTSLHGQIPEFRKRRVKTPLTERRTQKHFQETLRSGN